MGRLMNVFAMQNGRKYVVTTSDDPKSKTQTQVVRTLTLTGVLGVGDAARWYFDELGDAPLLAQEIIRVEEA